MPENPKSPRDQFVDDLLDASLRNYSRAEPLAGLESRVLRRLAEDPPKHSWLSGWNWTALGAVGTLAVVALALITYPPDVTRLAAPRTKQDVAPSVPARRGAPEERSSPAVPSVTAPPADHSIRMNKTIENSGTRPRDLFHRNTLPPCTPEQEAALKKKQAGPKVQEKVSQDCVPESVQPHPSQTRPPRH